MWTRKVENLAPEIRRIAATLAGGEFSAGCDPYQGKSGTLAGSGTWSGVDFGATHDAHAAMAVTFLHDLVDGWEAYANGAVVAAESFVEADENTAVAVDNSVYPSSEYEGKGPGGE
ncbi:hypothetical protein ACFQ3B_16815 [Stackebrandtia endophytica]|uniref:hypothetical protein n=1 Tax=Stackebrandtia endophytica TaxID=1496996 RepID=UPI00114ED35F|nr:hypothetical protein [Stackebrandtia endophytica]